MIKKAFTPFPVLITERLTLRQLMQNDDQDVFALRSDSEINKYLERQTSKTIEDAKDFINIVTENVKKNEAVYWAIIMKDSKTFVGSVCLFNFLDRHQKCEIGYELLGDFQGKGFMKEAASKAIEYAFQTIKIQTIEAFTHKKNQRSINLLEKLEFKKSPEPDNMNPDFYVFTLKKKNGNY